MGEEVEQYLRQRQQVGARLWERQREREEEGLHTSPEVRRRH
jgi:hypothetical protein